MNGHCGCVHISTCPHQLERERLERQLDMDVRNGDRRAFTVNQQRYFSLFDSEGYDIHGRDWLGFTRDESHRYPSQPTTDFSIPAFNPPTGHPSRGEVFFEEPVVRPPVPVPEGLVMDEFGHYVPAGESGASRRRFP